METFEQVCQAFEQMTAEQRAVLLEKKTVDVMEKLAEVTVDAYEATTLLGLFLTGAIMADDELATDEYAIMKKGYETLGLRTTFSECENLLKLTKITMNQVVGDLSEVIAELDDDIAADLLLICLTICSIDGEINAAEKAWIEKLFGE